MPSPVDTLPGLAESFFIIAMPQPYMDVPLQNVGDALAVVAPPNLDQMRHLGGGVQYFIGPLPPLRLMGVTILLCVLLYVLTD